MIVVVFVAPAASVRTCTAGRSEPPSWAPSVARVAVASVSFGSTSLPVSGLLPAVLISIEYAPVTVAEKPSILMLYVPAARFIHSDGVRPWPSSLNACTVVPVASDSSICRSCALFVARRM